MNWLFDSHIHLSDSEFDSDIHFIIKSMQKLHIKACCVSTDFQNSMKTLELAANSDLILAFVGIHPSKFGDNLDDIGTLVNHNANRISGIGEIGLDRTYVESEYEYDLQKKTFETLLSIAEKYKKPVSIHSRKTLDDIFEIMPSYSIKGVLLHWFDGNKKQLQKAMDFEFFVSYGPIMVYASDKQVLLSHTDKNKILVETDGPVRFSKCFSFKPAQISFIPSVVFCASKILKQSYDDFSSILEQNSKNYLGK